MGCFIGKLFCFVGESLSSNSLVMRVAIQGGFSDNVMLNVVYFCRWEVRGTVIVRRLSKVEHDVWSAFGPISREVILV